MKKALVITINNTNYNYGNRLQNYAVIKICEQLGVKCTTLCFERKRHEYFSMVLKRIAHFLTLYVFTNNKVYWKKLIKKDIAFLKFDKRFIKTLYTSDVDKFKDAYDFFYIGSDQVWNPLWYNEKRKNIYLLSFAENYKKICMTPSFGVDQLPEDWKEWFRSQLATFPKLSVREESGAQIIKSLTDIDADVIIDPTLVVSVDEWTNIEKKPTAYDGKPYILTYFLSSKSADASKTLAEVRQGRTVHELLDKTDPVTAVAGPAEFLYLFDHADLILTDSYHACIFSFLFNKPFIVFDRCESINMNSRIITLLSKLGIERKYYYSKIENNIWEHDYTEGYKQLEIERERAIKFLKDAMGI